MLDYAQFSGMYALSVQDMWSTALFFPAKTVYTFQNRTHIVHKGRFLYSPLSAYLLFFPVSLQRSLT